MAHEKLWPFAVLPAVILNIAGLLLFGSYYAFLATNTYQPDFGEDDLFFTLYLLIFLTEWEFFLFLAYRLKSQGDRLSSLLHLPGYSRRIRRLPLIGLFIAFNGLFAIYIWLVDRFGGGWPSFENWSSGQTLFMVVLIPLTAAITEEFIWRGYLLNRLLQRTTAWKAITLSALSFAFIHGFMPDRFLITFLLGLVAGYYYYKERRLTPIIVTHFILDVWSFSYTSI